MSDLEGFDPELSAALRRIGDEAVVPPIDPAQEERLLAAFDEHFRSRRVPRVLHAKVGVGFLAVAATIVFAVLRPGRTSIVHPPLAGRNPVAQAAPATLARAPEPARISLPEPPDRPDRSMPSFVMLPGARELPRFESGQLMRVDLPAFVVLSLGLRPSRPLRNDGTVQTDVLVGQDGFARAVRLVQ